MERGLSGLDLGRKAEDVEERSAGSIIAKGWWQRTSKTLPGG